MQTDLWRRFQGLGPSQTTLVATVTAHNPDGTSTLETPEGYSMRAKGRDVDVGRVAYVQDGRVLGEAASLPPLNLVI